MKDRVVSEQLIKLVSWTHAPEPEELQGILDALTGSDLMMGMTYLKHTPSGRLAWAEYGRRAGFFEFSIRTSVLDGKVRVAFEADAVPIHYGPIVRKS